MKSLGLDKKQRLFEVVIYPLLLQGRNIIPFLNKTDTITWTQPHLTFWVAFTSQQGYVSCQQVSRLAIPRTLSTSSGVIGSLQVTASCTLPFGVQFPMILNNCVHHILKCSHSGHMDDPILAYSSPARDESFCKGLLDS